MIKSIAVLAALIVAIGVFGLRVYRALWPMLRHGQPSGPFNAWGQRFRGLVVYVGAQLRLFRVLKPGTAHFFIFWGFLILSVTIVQAITEGLLSFSNPQYVLPVIGQFGPLALLQDLFALFVILAVVYGLYLRVLVDPLRYKGSHKAQGVLVLIFIFTIMLSLLVMNGVRPDTGEDPLRAWRPISAVVGRSLAGLAKPARSLIGEFAYWIHLGVVLLFLTELPEGKHFHVVTSIPAVFLRNLGPAGRLSPAPELDASVGGTTAQKFRWRQMLDFYTCTECGRCQDVCPAYASAQILSPKLLMMTLRDNLRQAERAPKRKTGAHLPAAQTALKGDAISEAALWSCTTCYACDQECPLFIEHVPPIVDMRRHLVVEGQVSKELQDALANLGRYGNSFGQSERLRPRWTQPIEPRIKDARREPVEYLWFVGDYASFSPTLTEVTLKTAKVFQRAGLDFGILYDGERNAGNDVRRVGEEGLFESLVEKNVAVLGNCSYSKIVTTDPHSYNTLKNEYPSNGGHEHSILHSAELLDHLIRSHELAFSKKLGYKVTYHDPCYLGRYNGVYDAPRRVIEATGCELVEMPRCGDRAFCCGAGGGRIWMKEGEMQERPSEIRIREALGLDGVTALVTACPKDVTMFRDAVKTTLSEGRLEVKDLSELVYEAL
jgi:Fe-S oxidoreductase